MKLLVCERCVSWVVPEGTRKPKPCACGRHFVWWEDPATGQLRVMDTARPGPDETAPWRSWRPQCWVIGVHNGLFESPEQITAPEVQRLLDETPDSYIFKRVRSLVIKFRVGQSSDTRYDDALPGAAA